MRLQELFKIAQQGGNTPERVVPDKREAFVYMDVTSSEYRKKAAKQHRKPSPELPWHQGNQP